VQFERRTEVSVVRRASSDPTPEIVATNNATGGKGPCFGHAWNEGTCQGMAGKTEPNHPVALQRDVNAQQPRPPLWTPAKPTCDSQTRRRRDDRRSFGIGTSQAVHAGSGRPSVSRVPEIGTHGLKGGPALSPMQFNV